MKRTEVVVAWPDGLHFRRASRLVQVAKGFRSTIWLRCNGRIAEVRNIIGVLTLCATMGTAILVEVVGEDELDAAWAIEQLFSSADGCEATSG